MGRASSTGQEAGIAVLLPGPVLTSSALVLFFPWFPCCVVVLHARYQTSPQTLKHGIHRGHQCMLGPTPAGNCLPVSPMNWRQAKPTECLYPECSSTVICPSVLTEIQPMVHDCETIALALASPLWAKEHENLEALYSYLPTKCMGCWQSYQPKWHNGWIQTSGFWQEITHQNEYWHLQRGFLGSTQLESAGAVRQRHPSCLHL